MFGYSLNYLIDVENAVIVDVEATPTRLSKEVDATETMIERSEERFNLKAERIAGDVAYGTREMLGWLVERDIVPHIPVKDQSEIASKGSFVRADFDHDEKPDVYICATGKPLTTTGRVFSGNTLCYRARKRDCQACPLKARCCPKSPERRISHDVNQDARDYTQALMQSEAYAVSCAERKKIERLFGEAKHILALTRLRLRGLAGARDEFLLTATVQNLKRLANLTAIPPPRPIAA